VEHCGPLPGPEPSCEPRICDGFAGLPCAEGEFCEHEAGTCEIVDQQGVCTAVPESCPAIAEPVCGCDGITYGNDCERRAARVQKAQDGSCGPGCTEACDCYRDATFPNWCAALECPACGCAWTCEQRACVVHVETPVPDPQCEVTDGIGRTR
jgi:hypothetical protein